MTQTSHSVFTGMPVSPKNRSSPIKKILNSRLPPVASVNTPRTRVRLIGITLVETMESKLHAVAFLAKHIQES
jgi:hypothetical protein